MYRGLTLFRCTNCGHTFMSHDMEYKATSFSMPQRCTKCGSVRTLPGILSRKKDYEKIWEEIEEAGEKGTN